MEQRISVEKRGFEAPTLRGILGLKKCLNAKRGEGGIVCNCLLTMEEFEYQTSTNNATLGSFYLSTRSLGPGEFLLLAGSRSGLFTSSFLTFPIPVDCDSVIESFIIHCYKKPVLAVFGLFYNSST